MNFKKIIILSLLAVMLLGCISTASAGWFDFLSGTTEVGGLQFKIPEGYSENNSNNDSESSSYVGKKFSNNDKHISIDVYNNSDNGMKLPEAGNDVELYGVMSSSISDFNIANNITWEEKEIGGHKGMFGVQHLSNRMPYEFHYIDGDKYIKIYVSDQSVLDKLFDIK